MKILFLTHSFNSLTQRLYAELTALGHAVSVEFDIADSVSEEAVALWRPELILAPFLKRAIPESIWQHHLCWIVHPGIVGDRGPSALDWAILNGETEWGVTVLQAEAEMDAGPVWATATFPLRRDKKASIYRQETTEAALRAVKEALAKLARGEKPVPLANHPDARGQLRPVMQQADRAIDWQRDDMQTVLRKIDAADGFPGVADSLSGEPCHLYDAWPEERLRGAPGELIARRETAVCRATVDGAVWIGHVKRPGGIKLPATVAFTAELPRTLPEAPLSGWFAADHATWQDIRYEEAEGVGFLHLLAAEAVQCGFYDAVLPAPTFRVDVARRAAEMVASAEQTIAAKRERRARDEAEKPLAAYRAEELERMRRNFYGFDPSYHVARWHFVAKSPQSWTPRHLAHHRELREAA